MTMQESDRPRVEFHRRRGLFICANNETEQESCIHWKQEQVHLVRSPGIEPDEIACKIKGSSVTLSQGLSQKAESFQELAEVLAVWPDLPPALRAAVLAIVRTHTATQS